MKGQNQIKETCFGERLRKYIFDHNMTVAEIERATGCDGSNICHYMNDGMQPSVRTLVAICKGLGVSADYLLGIRDGEIMIPEKDA